jgi:SpoVK/Ycf46/Vps4 family AAA+-type ATPase
MVNELLVQMEQFDGVFIASTNLMDVLDQAALRRFDLKLKLGLPETRSSLRRAIPRRLCGSRHLMFQWQGFVELLHGLDVLTPGDFAAIARRHRFEPFRSAKAIAASVTLGLCAEGRWPALAEVDADCEPSGYVLISADRSTAVTTRLAIASRIPKVIHIEPGHELQTRRQNHRFQHGSCNERRTVRNQRKIFHSKLPARLPLEGR